VHSLTIEQAKHFLAVVKGDPLEALYVQLFNAMPPLITEALATIKETADTLVRWQDYLGAAAIYETLVTGIFEESHLYSDEERDYDDYYDEEEPSYPAEEGLEEFVGECIDALGTCLADERADRVAREKIIKDLFDIYEHDLCADTSLGFTSRASDHLIRYATARERNTIGEWLRKRLEGSASFQRKAYGAFWLDLQMGQKFTYEYDFGSTTDLALRVT
jgi:hypothetical protein